MKSTKHLEDKAAPPFGLKLIRYAFLSENFRRRLIQLNSSLLRYRNSRGG
jgi:hypothetical protein